MQLIPDWAPNPHPMLIHFPIVLVVLAASTDVVRLLLPRNRVLSEASTAFFVLAALSAVAAYVSGRLAATTVFAPGMAHSLIDDHGSWGLLTTSALVGIAAFRLVCWLKRWLDTKYLRMAFAILGATAFFLVQQTAERGARLVYEQGVGVIPGPVPSSPESLDTVGAGEPPR